MPSSPHFGSLSWSTHNCTIPYLNGRIPSWHSFQRAILLRLCQFNFLCTHHIQQHFRSSKIIDAFVSSPSCPVILSHGFSVTPPSKTIRSLHVTACCWCVLTSLGIASRTCLCYTLTQPTILAAFSSTWQPPVLFLHSPSPAVFHEFMPRSFTTNEEALFHVLLRAFFVCLAGQQHFRWCRPSTFLQL